MAMTKTDSASFSDAAASQNTLFIDTNLGTHLAMVVLDRDTVSDLKEKIKKEHPQCFPHIGNIKIHAIKVKRKGHFYHLSDSMYLKSAFFGVNKSWFLSIDVAKADNHSNPSTDGLNLARNSLPGQICNPGAPALQHDVAQQYGNQTRNDSKDNNEPLESLPALNVIRTCTSKKRKAIMMNGHVLEEGNYFIDDNGQIPLKQDNGYGEKFRDSMSKEASDHLMIESKSNASEPCPSSFPNTHNASEYGLKGSSDLSLEIDIAGEHDGKNDESENVLHQTHDSLEGVLQTGSTVKKMREYKKINGAEDGQVKKRDLVSDCDKVSSMPEVTAGHLSEKKRTAELVSDSASTETKKRKKRRTNLLDYSNQAVGLISSGTGAQQVASREPDVTTVRRHDAEDASVSSLLGISGRKKHVNSDHKTEENFSLSPVGVSCDNKNNTDPGDVQSNRDMSELPHYERISDTTKLKKKKKTKKSKDSLEGRQINLVETTAIVDIPSTELHSIEGNNSSGKADIGGSHVPLMKRENIVSSSMLPTDMNINKDETNRGELEPLLQISKTQAAAENMDEQVRMKFKRPVTPMRSFTDCEAKEICNEDSSPSKRSNREVKSVSKTGKKIKLLKIKSVNEIDGAMLDSMRLSDVENRPSSYVKSRIITSSQIPSHASEGNREERYLEANICSSTTKDDTVANIDNHIEVSCESNKVDIKDRAGQLQPESVGVHVDKSKKKNRAANLPKAKGKKKDLHSSPSRASISPQNLRKSDENAEIRRYRQTSNSSTHELQGSSSKDECDRTILSDSRVKKISRGGVISPPSYELERHVPDTDNARVRANVFDTSGNSNETINEAFPVRSLSSKLKSSNKLVLQDQKHTGHQSTVASQPVGGRKTSRNGNRGVTRPKQENSLATSGAIFNDASSDSSEDDDGITDSDAGGKSPDISFSSELSDGESNANINSPGNRSIDLERKNTRVGNTRRIGPSSREDLTLDAILRSSSRYKKAKLTAAQTLLEDSQAVDVVPDSQPNP